LLLLPWSTVSCPTFLVSKLTVVSPRTDKLLEVWLQRWTSDKGGNLPMYISVYVLLSVANGFLIIAVLWYFHSPSRPVPPFS
jgi:ATP-binding cassette subfamily C (CFTR/MRP) protein 1